MQGRIQDFQKGGGHTLIERAISYHFSQKGCMYVRAPQVHVVIRAAPCREQSGDETNSGCGHIILVAHDRSVCGLAS